jgi:hypothetical protein
MVSAATPRYRDVNIVVRRYFDKVANRVSARPHPVARREFRNPNSAHRNRRFAEINVQIHLIRGRILRQVRSLLGRFSVFYKQSRFGSPEKHGFQDRCANISMRIQTSGDYEWRTDHYDRTTDRLDEGTRSGGIDGACEFTQEMLDNLEEAVEHPDMTEELAELLSTTNVTVEYRVETGLEID